MFNYKHHIVNLERHMFIINLHYNCIVSIFRNSSIRTEELKRVCPEVFFESGPIMEICGAHTSGNKMRD